MADKTTKKYENGRIGRVPPRLKGLLMMLAGAFCFSLVPIWVRAIEAYSPLSIVFYRALFGVFPLALWIIYTPEGRRDVSLRQLDARHRWVLLAAGISMCGTATTYYLAILNTSVAKAVLLHYTAPIYVAIFSPLILKEKNTPLTWLAVAAGIFGTALIVEPAELFHSDSGEMLGIVSGLFSGLFLSGVFLFGRFLAGHLPSRVRTLWGSVIAALILLPFGIQVPAGHFWHNLPFLIILGTVSLALPYTLFFKGQNYISAQVASVTALFEPVCGIGIGFLFFAETLTLTGFTGAGIVLLSISIASRR